MRTLSIVHTTVILAVFAVRLAAQSSPGGSMKYRLTLIDTFLSVAFCCAFACRTPYNGVATRSFHETNLFDTNGSSDGVFIIHAPVVSCTQPDPYTHRNPYSTPSALWALAGAWSRTFERGCEWTNGRAINFAVKMKNRMKSD